MNNPLKTSSWTGLILLSFVLALQAETITYQESVNQIKYANGTPIAFTPESIPGAGDATYDVLSVKLGWFNSGFTPTASNFSSWETNFNYLLTDETIGYTGKGTPGYAINPSAATLLGASNISVQISFGRNNPGGDYASLMPPNTSLWLIGSSVPQTDMLTSGSLYSSTAQFFAVQKSTWPGIPTVTADGGTTDFSLAAVSSSSDVIVGSYDSVTSSIIMVPEPSTGALMMIGAAGLVALRRLRKV